LKRVGLNKNEALWCQDKPVCDLEETIVMQLFLWGWLGPLMLDIPM